MNIDIVNKPLTLNIHGFGGVAVNKDYAGMAFSLMDRMWKIVKGKGLENKGLNIWLYGPNEEVFAGVELQGAPNNDVGLEAKNITLEKYGYYKHTGPYNLIKQAGVNMTKELNQKGFEVCLPYIEIYGHWTSDESKLETELLMCLR